jgi:TatD DNase family protein
MKLFDSHCHLDDGSFQKDLHAVVNRAAEAGVTKIMTIGVTLETSHRAVAMADSLDGVYAAVGIHPHDAGDATEAGLEELVRLAGRNRVRAWGEIGLDFNRMHSPREAQERWFVRQLEAAGSLALPVIFHERDSDGRLIQLLHRHFPAGRSGVIHCFSGTPRELEAYLEIGLHIGITGIVTIKGRGAPLRDLAPGIPADRLLIETDAPYLVPTPERNKFRRNEPAFVRSVLATLAEVRGEAPETLARQTYENTCRLYGITP